MTYLRRLQPAAAAIALAVGLMTSQAGAQDTPSATINFGGGGVAFIGSVSWGSGTLTFQGKRIPLRVSGVGVGAIGANKFSAAGEVYNLNQASDIEGTYSAIVASATAGAGAGVIDMKNANGVEIRAHSTSAGLKLALAPSGMTIRLK